MAKLGSISFLVGVLALAVVVIAAIGILNGYTSGTTTLTEEKALATESKVTEATVSETKILSEEVAVVKDSSTGKLYEAYLVEKSTEKKKEAAPAKPIAEKPGEPTKPGMKSPVGWCIRDAVQKCVGGGEKQQPPEKAKPPKEQPPEQKEKQEVKVKADLIATEESDDEIIDYELVFTEVPPEEEDYYAYAMDSYKVIDMYSVSDCVRDAVFSCLGGKGPEGKLPERQPAEAPARPQKS